MKKGLSFFILFLFILLSILSLVLQDFMSPAVMKVLDCSYLWTLMVSSGKLSSWILIVICIISSRDLLGSFCRADEKSASASLFWNVVSVVLFTLLHVFVVGPPLDGTGLLMIV